jgi:hypothetical protein
MGDVSYGDGMWCGVSAAGWGGGGGGGGGPRQNAEEGCDAGDGLLECSLALIGERWEKGLGGICDGRNCRGS